MYVLVLTRLAVAPAGLVRIWSGFSPMRIQQLMELSTSISGHFKGFWMRYPITPG